MPRKRTVPDQALLDDALLVVRESGPEALTFAALSARVGLAGSTIVQRFGTKAGLLRAALGRAWELLEDQTAQAATTAGPGPSGVIDMLVQLTGQYDPKHFADQLLILREDLRDPVLRARGQRWLTTLSGAVEQRLGAGDRDVSGMGELVVAHWQGTLTVWSFQQDVALPEKVRAALEDLFRRLEP